MVQYLKSTKVAWSLAVSRSYQIPLKSTT